MAELQTLVKYTRKLELVFQSDRAVLLHLLQEDVISQNFFDEVDDPKSMLSPAQKAAKIVTELKRLVSLDPEVYHLLLNYLKQHKKYKAVVKNLNEEYCDAEIRIRKQNGKLQRPSCDSVVE